MFKINPLQDLQTLSKQVKWQYFEKLVGWIFEQNGFEVKVNVVKVKPRRQYDIVAEKFNKIFLVDCKKWKGGRYKTSSLKKAVEKHLERTGFFQTEKTKIPIIVTLMDEDINIHEDVPIVPIDKLNTFLNPET